MLPIFSELNSENKPGRQKCVSFQKLQKVLNHSTQLYGTSCKLQVVETALKCGGFSVLMHSLQYTVQTKLNFFQVE